MMYTKAKTFLVLAIVTMTCTVGARVARADDVLSITVLLKQPAPIVHAYVSGAALASHEAICPTLNLPSPKTTWGIVLQDIAKYPQDATVDAAYAVLQATELECADAARRLHKSKSATPGKPKVFL